MIVTKILNIPLTVGNSIHEAYINVPWKISEIRTRQMCLTKTEPTLNYIFVNSSLIGNETHGALWANTIDNNISTPFTIFRFRAPIFIQGIYQFQVSNVDGTPFIPTAGTVLTMVLEFDEDFSSNVVAPN